MHVTAGGGVVEAKLLRHWDQGRIPRKEKSRHVLGILNWPEGGQEGGKGGSGFKPEVLRSNTRVDKPAHA